MFKEDIEKLCCILELRTDEEKILKNEIVNIALSTIMDSSYAEEVFQCVDDNKKEKQECSHTS